MSLLRERVRTTVDSRTLPRLRPMAVVATVVVDGVGVLLFSISLFTILTATLDRQTTIGLVYLGTIYPCSLLSRSRLLRHSLDAVVFVGRRCILSKANRGKWCIYFVRVEMLSLLWKQDNSTLMTHQFLTDDEHRKRIYEMYRFE